MAVTPQDQNEAFFREVDDEVRREKMEGFARRYGMAIALGLVVLLVAAAAALFWSGRRDALSGERAERFDGALSQLSSGKPDDARKTFQSLAAGGAKGYAPLAQLMLADMAIQDGKDQDAGTAFMKVAQDKGVSQPLRDLALVRATALNFDTLAPDEVVNRMKPLAVPGNPWFGSAGEMTALADMKLGQPQRAGALFVSITRDATVPATIRARAAQLAGDLGFTPVQPADSSPR